MQRGTPAAAVELIEGVILLVHPRGKIPSDEWGLLVEKMRRFGATLTEVRVVVVADGTLNTEQRRDLKRLSEHHPRVAPARVMLISESMISRGVMQALAWMGMNTACTSRKQAPMALREAGLQQRQIDAVLLAIARIEAQLLV